MQVEACGDCGAAIDAVTGCARCRPSATPPPISTPPPIGLPPPVVEDAVPTIVGGVRSPLTGVHLARGLVIAGRFELVDRLGAGGMGDVFTARQQGLERLVCLKIPRLSADDEVVRRGLAERFRLEARAASRVEHPNVVRIIDVGEDPAVGPYYAMEYLTGTPLDGVMRREFPMGEERVCRLVAEVLEGLAAAHAANVVHRDLKPQNIMLVAGPDGAETVKILDFGLARLLDGPRLTRTGVVSGTPAYMSPEQVNGGEVDARSDLYAVGVLLYEMLTNTLPFGGPDTEILLAQLHEPPEPPRVRRPQVAISEDVERVVLRAMEKDPAKRPANAGELRRELLRIADKAREEREAARRASAEHRRREEAARLESRLQELKKPASPSRALVVGVVAVVLVAAAALAFALRGGSAASAEAPAPVPVHASSLPTPVAPAPSAPAPALPATAAPASAEPQPAPAAPRPRPSAHPHAEAPKDAAAPGTTPAPAAKPAADDDYKLEDLKNPYGE